MKKTEEKRTVGGEGRGERYIEVHMPMKNGGHRRRMYEDKHLRRGGRGLGKIQTNRSCVREKDQSLVAMAVGEM